VATKRTLPQAGLSLAEPALSLLVVPEGTQVVAPPEVPPVDVREVQFGVDRLPDHEIGEPFGPGFDDQIRHCREDETSFDVLLVDVRWVETAGLDLFGDSLDRLGELVFSPEADADLDGGVGLRVVVGRPDGNRTRRVEPFEFASERRNDFPVEDAHVDDDPLGPELERPAETVRHGLIRTLFEQVAFGDDDRDRLGQLLLREPEAAGEIPVVQSHMRPFQGSHPKHTGCAGPVSGRDCDRVAPGDGARGPERVSAGREYRWVVTSTVRRAAAFALVGCLALVGPWVLGVQEPAVATVAAVGPFLLVAVFALTIDPDNVLFELFARPGDRRKGKLYGLAGFSLAAAGISILTVGFDMPYHVYVGTVFLLAFGNLAGQLVRSLTYEQVRATAGFVAGGFLAGCGGQLLTTHLAATSVSLQMIAFLAASGSLFAALLRQLLFKRDDALVMVSVALMLWLFVSLPVEISTTRILVALGVTVALGYVSYALETASLPGMLTGVLLGLLTIVLGDYGWFVMLIAFFGIGGLSSKFRFDRKLDRGIAQENEGARGTGNVLANSLVALVAVLAAAISPTIGISESIFFYAFAGAVGAALADTLSSEIGGLFDHPRLITTLEVVEPGTDGAVTWQGELVGVTGTAIIAAIGLVAFDGITTTGAGLIVLAGFAGMTVDSFLGATVEGRFFGNQGVNFFATLAAALVGAGLAVLLGLSM